MSANASNLDQFKMLLFGNGLIPTFNDPKKVSFRKPCGHGRKS